MEEGGREEVDNQDQTPLCADERWKHGGRRLVSVCVRDYSEIFLRPFVCACENTLICCWTVCVMIL